MKYLPITLLVVVVALVVAERSDFALQSEVPPVQDTPVVQDVSPPQSTLVLPQEPPKEEARIVERVVVVEKSICPYCKGEGCDKCDRGLMDPLEAAKAKEQLDVEAKEAEKKRETQLARERDEAETRARKEKEVDWLYSVDTGQRTASELQRPVMLAFTARNCAICDVVKARVYSSSRVMREVSKETVPVWCYIEPNDPRAMAFARSYGAVPFPKVVILLPNGQRRSFTPETNPERFLDQLNTAIGG